MLIRRILAWTFYRVPKTCLSGQIRKILKLLSFLKVFCLELYNVITDKQRKKSSYIWIMAPIHSVGQTLQFVSEINVTLLLMIVIHIRARAQHFLQDSMCAQWRLNSTNSSVQSDQSSTGHSVGSQGYKASSGKERGLIKLRTGWSVSLLGAHAIF